MRIAIVAITGNGAALGGRLTAALPGAELHISRRYAGRSAKGTKLFEPTDLKQLIASLWEENDALVCIMATGIVVRMVAQLLKSKESDPAVVVMDDAGRFAISLLSGHLGGANQLAEQCAHVVGARAVITTATDANDLPSFDMLAKDHGWGIDDISRVKILNSLLLDGHPIAVVDPTAKCRPWFHGRGHLSYFATFSEAISSNAAGCLFVTNRHIPEQLLTDNLLILRPKNLVLGIGCNRGTSAEEIEEFVCQHLKRLFLSLKSVSRIASADAKRDEAGLLAFAGKHAISLSFYDSTALNGVTVPSAPSQHAFEAIGATGVAEPAAILASAGGKLLLNKVKSANVTLAVAEITNVS